MQKKGIMGLILVLLNLIIFKLLAQESIVVGGNNVTSNEGSISYFKKLVRMAYGEAPAVCGR